ncbi:MAG: cache domain-containing protein [Bdellovibrio sp.]
MSQNFNFIIAALLFLSSLHMEAAENCTSSRKVAVCSEESIKEKVNWACQELEKKGKLALLSINAMRFECCGEPNYVWINDSKPKMIIHPLKPNMNGMNLKDEQDPTGKNIFVEFTSAATRSPAGSWVSYQWVKFGEKTPTQKKSWVRSCKVKDIPDPWIVGSGTWE